MQLELIKRDEALERVVNNAGDDWKEAAIAHICAKHWRQQMTGEDMRIACQKVGILPHHPNAWGGLIAGMIKQKHIRPTNRFVHMKAPGSHGRMTRVYEVL